MSLTLAAAEIQTHDLPLAGGKALALAALSRVGFRVPDFICITTEAYNAFVDRTGLRERIYLELNRKDFRDMRWEEVWDCATRIRNLFLRQAMPPALSAELRRGLTERMGAAPVAVRSSATDEDAAVSSFAGLHESYIGIRGTDAVLEHVRKVWASLWSDAALLYRQELGLDVGRSAMAVLVQKMIGGARSGVAFSQSPSEPSQAVVEAVYGLNAGLVDGSVEPDRWVIDRDFGRILGHTAAVRQHRFSVSESGAGELVGLAPAAAAAPPLTDDEVRAVYALARRAEAYFGAPQDVEWTLEAEQLFLLQSRRVTTRPQAAGGDERAWYLSLHRSLESLKALRIKIEQEHLPAMTRTAQDLAAIDLAALGERELAAEIRRRHAINTRWVGTYWEDFIPFAHAIRLFGQAYNDAVKPDDPYAFVDLLTRTGMASLERNRLLEELAGRVRSDPQAAACLETGDCGEKAPEFRRALEDFIARFGDLSCTVTGGTQCEGATRPLARILLKIASQPPSARPAGAPERGGDALRRQFMDALPASRQAEAAELLELARVSYRLRDDDNIHIGRIEAQLLAAVNEGRRRLEDGPAAAEGRDALKAALEQTDVGSRMHPSPAPQRPQGDRVRPRQLVGQPAGQGVARGMARVIHEHADLADFSHGEVLVCDAVDPNMTFVVPLAAAVVERRGGMLIHGAIIAREYGLPCVTGIADAAAFIRTGDTLTVDGYLGIVTIDTGAV